MPGMPPIPPIMGPSFFMTLPDGSESQVPFDVRDEFVVLHTVALPLSICQTLGSNPCSR